MKVTETHLTTIVVEHGDKVRDLAEALNRMPNGAQISVLSLPGWDGRITVDHLETNKG